MKKILFPLATLLLFGGLVSCTTTDDSSTDPISSQTSAETSSTSSVTETSSTTEEIEDVAIIDSYAYSEITDGDYGDGSYNTTAYQLLLFEGNLYRMTTTLLTYGYSMNLGTSSTIVYGTYETGTSEDGYTQVTLNAASELIVNSFSLAGGYSISINTADPDQGYPVELPAKSEGEKIYASEKQDVIDYSGTGYVVYLEDGKNVFSFTDPLDETSTTITTVTTASGDVSSIAPSTVNWNQLNSVFTMPASYGDGSYVADVYQILTYDDGSYEQIKTTVTYGYTMNLGTEIVSTIGDSTIGNSEDGYTAVTLNEAEDVILDSYSLAGGYNISINTTDPDQGYPVELPAQSEGQKIYANEKQDVIDAYGEEVTYYFNDNALYFSFTDPNA